MKDPAEHHHTCEGNTVDDQGGGSVEIEANPKVSISPRRPRAASTSTAKLPTVRLHLLFLVAPSLRSRHPASACCISLPNLIQIMLLHPSLLQDRLHNFVLRFRILIAIGPVRLR